MKLKNLKFESYQNFEKIVKNCLWLKNLPPHSIKQLKTLTEWIPYILEYKSTLSIIRGAIFVEKSGTLGDLNISRVSASERVGWHKGSITFAN